jgi:uncharacterized delta-60 repeat protein
MKKTILLSIALGIITISNFAQTNFSDYSFGNLGVVLTDFGDGSEIAHTIAVQADGKIIIAGYSYIGNGDILIARLDQNGNLDNSFGNNGKVITDLGGFENSNKMKIIILDDGSFLLMSGTDVSGFLEFLVLKYNSDGSLFTDFNGTGYIITSFGEYESYASDMELQSNGKIIVTGMHFSGETYDFVTIRLNSDGTQDGTFGSGGFILTDLTIVSPFLSDLYEFPLTVGIQSDDKIIVAGYYEDLNMDMTDYAMVGYTADGLLNTSFGNNGYILIPNEEVPGKEYYHDIAIQDDDKIIYTGANSHIDELNEEPYDVIVGRLNPDGSNDLTFNSTGSLLLDLSNIEEGVSIISQPDGKILVGGYTNVNSDNDFLLVRINSNGTLDQSFGNNGVIISNIFDCDILYDVAYYSENCVVACGLSDYFNNVKFTTSKYFTNTNISGTVFIDENSDGIMNELDQGVAQKIVKIEPGPYYLSTNNSGNYCFANIPDTYNITYQAQQYWELTTPNETFEVIIENQLDIFTDLDFGIIPKLDITDVSASLTCNAARPLFETNYWLSYQNFGTNTQEGLITFEYDPLLIFIETDFPPISHVGNIITWEYDTLTNMEQRNIFLKFQVPGIDYLGDTLTSFCSITPFEQDTLITNNYDTINQIITGSYDPNDKQVSPQGLASEGYLLHDTKLTYTVRFQNTGTDTAFNIVVIDTLDADLNIETFQFIASSHPCTYEIFGRPDGKTIIAFRFSNILLPHEAVNEPGSNGFLKFSINPDENLADYTQVSNLAYIYFDYNPPIITNEVTNTFVSTLTNIQSHKLSYSIYPNPTTGIVKINAENLKSISVYSIDGKHLKSEYLQNEIDLSNFQNGIYLIKIETETGSYLEKIMKQ